MPVCVVCSGKEFICESGHYFCSECQTQSQDVRQELHDNDMAEDEGQTIGGKRRRSAKASDGSTTEEENMTSWEGFNFALVGLVDELICLGANPNLKIVVLKLWSSYLRKMEVAFFSKDGPALPKLGPNFKKYDANIIYGYETQKGKRQKPAEENSSAFFSEDNPSHKDNNLQRQHVMKNNRAAFHQTYEKMMLEMSTASQTLTDVTLEMLAISEIEGSSGAQELQFNADGQAHQQLQGMFHAHPGLLLRNKILCLLYLGLLHIDETIHLSDLLRWIMEGHLSYSRLSRFFPADAQLCSGNYSTFAAHQPPPSYEVVLSATQHIAAYIGLKALKAPPLKDLIQHYITELNLPLQVGVLAERLLDLMPNNTGAFPVSLKSVMPNWEGRAMAHIIITLKLIFGLDDGTEHRNSRVARKINELIISQNQSRRLFVWDDWVRFCVFRRTALILHHQPTQFQSSLATSKIQNIDSIISTWKSIYRCSNDTKRRTSVLQGTYKRVACRLLEKNVNKSGKNVDIIYPATLSPNTQYTEIIQKAYQDGKIKAGTSEWDLAVNRLNYKMLDENFKTASVDYLTHPDEYIQWAQSHGLRIGLHSGSAASSINVSHGEKSNNADGSLHRVKVYLDLKEEQPSKPPTTLPSRNYKCHKPLILPEVKNKIKKESTPLPLIDAFTTKRVITSAITKKKVGRPKLEKKCYDKLSKADEDNMLHIPFTEYWKFNFPANTSFAKVSWQLPHSFKLVLEECATLLQMSPGTLYKEVAYLETLHKDLSQYILDCNLKDTIPMMHLKKSW